MMADFWDSVGRLADGPRLETTQDGWTELLYWERLLGLTGQSLNQIPAVYASAMPKEIAARQARLEQSVREAVTSYGPIEPASEMKPVCWK